MLVASFYHRYGLRILVLAVGLVPLIVLGDWLAVDSNSNDVHDWLPAHYPETSELRWFQTYFGSKDFVVASWPGCPGRPQATPLPPALIGSLPDVR
jgi:hypothetical protein